MEDYAVPTSLREVQLMLQSGHLLLPRGELPLEVQPDLTQRDYLRVGEHRPYVSEVPF